MPKYNEYNIFSLKGTPGILKDMPAFSTVQTLQFIDGEWVRFVCGTPQKIGGWKAISYGVAQENVKIGHDTFSFGQITDMYSVFFEGSLYVYFGTANSCGYFVVPNGFSSINIDSCAITWITPHFPPNINYTWDKTPPCRWTFTLFAQASGATPIQQIVAQCCDAEGTSQVYFGNAGGNIIPSSGETPQLQRLYTISPASYVEPDPTVPITGSGGVLFCAPILLVYGASGFVAFTNPVQMVYTPSGDEETTIPASIHNWVFNIAAASATQPTLIYTNTVVSSYDCVYAASISGSSSPTVLLWTTKEIVLMNWSQVPAQPGATEDTYTFDATTLDSSISIISKRCVVQVNQIFYWLGIDEMYQYTGAVQSLINQTNKQWFFDNLNIDYASLVWGTYNAKFQEIWWFFPYGNSTVCNAALIYNVVGNFWEHTLDIYRSAGVPASVFSFPIYASSQANVTLPTEDGKAQNYFPIYAHEIGVDAVTGNDIQAIPSSITYPFFTLAVQSGVPDAQVLVCRLEVNSQKSGVKSAQVIAMSYPSDYESVNYLISEEIVWDEKTQFIDFQIEGRIIAIKIACNNIGSSYHMGIPLLNWKIGSTANTSGKR